MFQRRIYLPLLAVIFLLFAILMVIDPVDRHGWLLENVLVILFVLLIAGTYRQFPQSRISYMLIFLFLMLHEIGSHYTYALLPYDQWFHNMTGTGVNDLLGFERNHFDHFTDLPMACYSRIPFARCSSVLRT